VLFLIILILSFAAGFILPWWLVAIISFLAALIIGKTSGKGFLSGFLGVAIAWIALALMKSIPNENILAGRVATLFHLPNWIFILVITAVTGGLIGGLAAWSGVLFRKALQKISVNTGPL
jgi:hypothetical protein